MNDRLTVNAGLRYDYVTGFLIDQSKIPNYVALTAAAAAGRFNGVPGFDEFGKKAAGGQEQHPAANRRGVRPPRRRQGRRARRLGHLLRLRVHEREHPVPGLSAQGGSGVVFTVTNTAGIKNPDGSFFSVGQPISNIASQNEVKPERAVLQLERRRARRFGSRGRARRRSAGRTSSRRRRCSTSITCTSTGRISASAGR